MTLNVNFDKNRCLSTDKVNIFVIVDMSKVSNKAQLKQIDVKLKQMVTLKTS